MAALVSLRGSWIGSSIGSRYFGGDFRGAARAGRARMSLEEGIHDLFPRWIPPGKPRCFGGVCRRSRCGQE